MKVGCGCHGPLRAARRRRLDVSLGHRADPVPGSSVRPASPLPPCWSISSPPAASAARPARGSGLHHVTVRYAVHVDDHAPPRVAASGSATRSTPGLVSPASPSRDYVRGHLIALSSQRTSDEMLNEDRGPGWPTALRTVSTARNECMSTAIPAKRAGISATLTRCQPSRSRGPPDDTYRTSGAGRTGRPSIQAYMRDLVIGSGQEDQGRSDRGG